MKTLAELKAAAEAAVQKMKDALKAAETEDRDPTAEELAAFDAAEKQVESLLKQIDRMERADKHIATIGRINVEVPKAKDATGVVKGVTEPSADPIRARDMRKDLTPFELVGTLAWASVKNKHYPTKTALQHLEDAGFNAVADMSRATSKVYSENKALTSLGGGGGDNVVFTPLANEFIDFLRNSSIFMSSGPIELDMSYGSIKIPGGLAGVSGTYGAESGNIGYEQATTRQVSMSAKHLGVVTAMSNYMLDVSPLAVASIIGNDVATGLSLSMDAAGLRGDGQTDNPAGILTLTHADHTFDVADENQPTYEEIDREVQIALTLWRGSNVPRIRPVWKMSSRTFTYLQFMRDGSGNLIYPGLSLPVPIWYDSIPVKWSNQVPQTLGTGTNESEVYLSDFGHILVGVARALKLASSTEASYIDGSAAHISAFSRDQTVIRGTCSHDFDMRHTKAAVVMQAVKWGAPD